jgi:ABC-type Fe3+-hydroxamate transport system substrate-binding protein
MPRYRSDGPEIVLDNIPCRIISLVPSQTELLSDLGLENEVVGITKFCIHPERWFQTKTRVGGTKQLKPDIIRKLAPDLIIANKEENVKEQVEELSRHFPVWTSDVNNLEGAYEMIRQIGIITEKKEIAELLVDRLQRNFSPPSTPGSWLRAAYLIWQKPFMTVGGDTFIHSMMEVAGFDNVFKDRLRYPEITLEDLEKTSCQLLFLSSEPFPFKQKHVEELQPHLCKTKIVLVDGEMFSWYGSRLLKAPGYFEQLRRRISEIINY